MNRVGLAFLILCSVIILVTMSERKGISSKAIKLDKSIFYTGSTFNISFILVIAILAVIYIAFW